MVTFAKCFGGGMPIGITLLTLKFKNKKKKNFFWWNIFRQLISTKVGLDTFNYKKTKKELIST